MEKLYKLGIPMFSFKSQRKNKSFDLLQKQAHLDLTKRARGGILIYLVVWLIISIWAKILQSNPVFFYVNTLILVIFFLIRSYHLYAVTSKKGGNTKNMHALLVCVILIEAFYWGVLSAMIIFGNYNGALHYPFMILIAAFAIGGTIILSISRKISDFYPLLMFGPTLIAGAIIGGAENYVLLTLAVLSIFYVLDASRVSHDDYHKAIYNHSIVEEKAKQMEQLSITDQLTSLHNRMFFNNRYTQVWKCCLEKQLPLSVFMIDLDHFKKINDTFGHLAGDECLRKIATILKTTISDEKDTVARFGGEEFIVLLPERNIDKSYEVAKNILQSIRELDIVLNNQNVSLTCSIGIASTIPNNKLEEKDLIIAVDNALYQAKSKGRDQCFLDRKFPY